MASNVIVLYNQRRHQIKVTPTRSLSDVHTEACQKFNLDPLKYTLKRGTTPLDLSLQIRFTNLGPGAKLDLIPTRPPTTPLTIVLRLQSTPPQELSGQCAPTATLWSVLRSFEKLYAGLNLTERYASSATLGAGRLLYEVPAVRVANREFVGVAEMQTTLVGLGLREGRVAIVVGWRSSEVPLEVALEEIESVAPRAGAEEVPAALPAQPKASRDAARGDTEMGEAAAVVEGAVVEAPVGADAEGVLQGDENAPASGELEKPTVSVYRPSDSQTLAAAQINVPETAYEIGINEAKIIQHHLKKAAIGRRLPSDKEIEEKEAAALAVVEKVQTLVIKVRFPDGYISEQTLQAKHTAQDLYDTIRTTLRHPLEPFTLVIPPRLPIPESRQRLTIDLRIRSGATVHLTWDGSASKAARTEPALNDQYLDASRALPDVKLAQEEGEGAGAGLGVEGWKGKAPEKRPMDREAKESKLKALFGLGKGRK
ncbi:uncharacterized protein H6S33_005117 [Morchella sextelata]|uniref:uncharacterized protein n=1 Tax=Morchella sextelata TaxID=1174677 RepID=UPI001D049E30|nr:uncharacterized protein H6S33_005117 [Morchella sextelata]KAH0605135.1 hypothetical protein H6S33_005117 [Morchella sextelata]